MPARILHLDIDGFLASVEQILDPALKGQPVAVGSGVVASRSYEAKARGVETAMSMLEARRRCPELVVRDGDARVVERFRQRVTEVLNDFVPVVEVCSLDDMYGDLRGLAELGQPRGAVVLAQRIRSAVREATGLSVSQGLGASRTVARMATSHAKPGGILEVPEGGERPFLDPHSVEDLPGVGRRSAELLHALRLHRVGDLRQVERELLRQTFGQRGEDLYWRARGFDAGIGDEPREPQVSATVLSQSISRETSFEASDCRDFLFGMLAYLLDRAAAELRDRELLAKRVSLRMRFVDGMSREQQRSLRQASDRTDRLQEVARGLCLRLLDERRVLVRLLGVSLGNLRSRVGAQGELFAAAEERRGGLFAALDRVRGRHGFGKLVLGNANELLGRLPNGDQGFRLRTPSLSK
ncbi:MAG: DNA polymerase Y family protein [Planctomycetota bacterium]|jgi:DNA polymerase-4